MNRVVRSIRFRAARLLEQLDALAWRARSRRLGLRRDGAGGVSTARRRGPFAHERVTRSFQHSTEIEGRLYNYVHYPASSDVLCIHFSAFFGEWGDERRNRPQFAGYFHRLRMFWPFSQYQFLFLCDTFGADRNGTYYKGEDGDFFVERAVDQLAEDVRETLGIDRARVVTMGSSMGATGALRTALKHDYAGIVSVSPHIDLDLSAIHQGRRRHVAAVLGADDVDDPRHYAVTREIRRLAAETSHLPRLVMQSMEDDAGVHEEQVLPLVGIWREHGGDVRTDYRPNGGHTSEHATPEFFDDAVRWVLERR